MIHPRKGIPHPRPRPGPAPVRPFSENQDDPSYGCVDWYQYSDRHGPALVVEDSDVAPVDERPQRTRQ